MSDDDLDLNTLNDDELVEQMGDDLYDGLKEEIEEGRTHSARSWLDPLRRADQVSGRRHDHRG